MKNPAIAKISYHRMISLVGVMFPIVILSTMVYAEDTKTKESSHTNHKTNTSSISDQPLTVQIRELQTKVAKLEATLKQKHNMKSSMKNSSMKKDMGLKSGMGMAKVPGQGKSGMSMMSDKKNMMGGQAKSSMTMGNKGMAMMGQMKGMGQMKMAMKMASSLPGFAGASHIYHIGATSFFLDHSQHITLTKEQQIKLNQLKEKVLLGQATSGRWIAQGEQELWVLTSSDIPNATKIEAKIREIEKTRSDKRIAYIRAVGEAARVLTEEQRKTLVGNLPPSHNAKGADK